MATEKSEDLAQRVDLILRNTQEVVTRDELLHLMATKQNPNVYWGTAPTGPIHIGYFIPGVKLSNFVSTGFNTTILIADIHAYLDAQKTPWDQLDKRSAYYEGVMRTMLGNLGVDTSRLKFVKGSEFQTSRQYVFDVLKMAGITDVLRARRSAAEVVKQQDNPLISSLVYPLMQIADVPGLQADVSYGGVDQRKIYMLGRELLPQLGCEAPLTCVFTPMPPRVTGKKMRASEPESKIDLMDSDDVIRAKIKKAFCPDGAAMLYAMRNANPLAEDRIRVEGGKFSSESAWLRGVLQMHDIPDSKLEDNLQVLADVFSNGTIISSPESYRASVVSAGPTLGRRVIESENGILAFLGNVVFPIKSHKGEKFIMRREMKHGGDVEYDSFSDLLQDYVIGNIFPGDLKSAAADAIIELVTPIRKFLDTSGLYAQAYGDRK